MKSWIWAEMSQAVFVHVVWCAVCAGQSAQNQGFCEVVWDDMGPCCCKHLRFTVHLIWLHFWLLCVQNFHVAQSFAISISVTHESHKRQINKLWSSGWVCTLFSESKLFLLVGEVFRESVLFLRLKFCCSFKKFVSFSLLVESLLPGCSGWFWSYNLLSETYWVAGIIGVCHLAHIVR